MTGEAEFKWVGTHAQEIIGGRMLAPGETITLTEEQLHDSNVESLLADGGLIAVDDKGEHQAGLAVRRVQAREDKLEERTVSVGDTVPEPEPQPEQSQPPKTGKEEAK